MAWEYSDKTMKLFMDAVHGKPGTHMGEIENPDGIGEHGSISCGDAIRFTFKVDKHASDPLLDEIVKARYLTFGCTSAIAASEALCAIIEAERRTPIAALKITNQHIVDYLEGLPEQKIHCSVMGAEALEAAVFDWARRRGVDLKELGVDIHTEEHEDEGRVVCKCFSVTEPYLKRKIRELNLRTIPEITNAIKAGGACMSCHHAPGGLQDTLDAVWGRDEDAEPPEPELPVELSPYQRIKNIEKTIDEYVRPMMQADGGDLELVDIRDFEVHCRLKGACADCPGSAATLKLMVEQSLKERVDERIQVVKV